MRTEQEKKSTQKITDFADKSLLIVDDDNPLRDRLARAMEKKRFSSTSGRKCRKGDKSSQKYTSSVCGDRSTFGRWKWIRGS